MCSTTALCVFLYSRLCPTHPLSYPYAHPLAISRFALVPLMQKNLASRQPDRPFHALLAFVPTRSMPMPQPRCCFASVTNPPQCTSTPCCNDRNAKCATNLSQQTSLHSSSSFSAQAGRRAATVGRHIENKSRTGELECAACCVMYYRK